MIEDEGRLDREIRAALRRGPAPASPCPGDDSLASFYAGELAESEEEGIREHLSACAACVARARDARSFAAAMARPREGAYRWRHAAAAVLAGVAILLLWHGANEPPGPSPIEVPGGLPVEKAPYDPEGDGGLVWRGGGSAEEPSVEGSFRWAMEPYARDAWAEASSRLERRLRVEPRDERARFYLGVARLLDAKPAEAAEALRPLAEGSSDRSVDASWYLALALLETGDADAARSHLRRVASGEGPSAARARRLLGEIEETPRR